MIESLLEYGLTGAIVAAGLLLVVVPIVKAMITQQRESLDLLRRAVEANTVAVEAFRTFEVREHEVHTRLVETQDLILSELRAMRNGR